MRMCLFSPICPFSVFTPQRQNTDTQMYRHTETQAHPLLPNKKTSRGSHAQAPYRSGLFRVKVVCARKPPARNVEAKPRVCKVDVDVAV